jgi:hypothetical protein
MLAAGTGVKRQGPARGNGLPSKERGDWSLCSPHLPPQTGPRPDQPGVTLSAAHTRSTARGDHLSTPCRQASKGQRLGGRPVGAQLELDCYPFQLHRIRLRSSGESSDHARRRAPRPFLASHWSVSALVIHVRSTKQTGQGVAGATSRAQPRGPGITKSVISGRSSRRLSSAMTPWLFVRGEGSRRHPRGAVARDLRH